MHPAAFSSIAPPIRGTTFRRQEKLMGSRFELVGTHTNPETARRGVELAVSEIKRLESLLSEFLDDSITSRINRNAGIRPVEVPGEVHQLLTRCLEWSSITQGAFDITVGPLKKLYRFDNTSFSLPSRAGIESALKLTGYRHVQLLDHHRVFLAKKGMRISFASCGKGLAADRARDVFLEADVTAGAVNASGDLTVWGPDARRVGIADPDHPDTIRYYVSLKNGSVATSGDYEQHFIHRGKRYSHNLNPRTGLPLTGIKSVTTIGPHAELCDALSTAVYTMGAGPGLHLLNQLPGVHGIIIDAHDQTHRSDNVDLQPA